MCVEAVESESDITSWRNVRLLVGIQPNVWRGYYLLTFLSLLRWYCSASIRYKNNIQGMFSFRSYSHRNHLSLNFLRTVTYLFFTHLFVVAVQSCWLVYSFLNCLFKKIIKCSLNRKGSDEFNKWGLGKVEDRNGIEKHCLKVFKSLKYFNLIEKLGIMLHDRWGWYSYTVIQAPQCKHSCHSFSILFLPVTQFSPLSWSWDPWITIAE